MPTQQFNNYANLITFTRASSGTALRPISYGPELVVNGNFSGGTTTGWVGSGAALSVVGGRLAITSTSAATVGVLYTVGAPYPAGVFEAVFDIEPPSGKTVVTYIRNAAGPSYSSPQTAAMSRRQSTNSTEAISFFWTASAAGEVLYLDNVSVKQVIFDQAGDPLTLFNHPNNVPRIEYDANRNRLGLLIEEARTNLLLYSGELTNAAWGKNLLTVSTATDDFYTLTSTGSNSSISINFTIPASSTFTFYADFKARNQNFAFLQINAATTGGTTKATRCYIDLTTGQVANVAQGNGGLTGATVSSVRVLSDTWRVIITATVDSDHTSFAAIGGPATSLSATSTAAGQTVDMRRPQLELGAFPTSYIPTTGAAVTRAVDIASISTSAFGYNVTTGTVVATVIQSLANRVGTRRHIWATIDGGNNRIGGRASDGNAGFFEPTYSVGTGTSVVTLTVPTVTGPSYRTALAYSAQNSVAATNGTLSSAAAGYAGVPRPAFDIGCTGSGNQICGYITSIQYYPRQLSPAQIQELTR